MNKYYGLRLARTLLIASSVVISITTIATIGAAIGLTLQVGEPIDGVQALITLIIGGLIALFCYAFGQLIDININNYQVSWELKEQLKQANRLNHKTVEILNKQMIMMNRHYNLKDDVDIQKIEQQLEQRRSKYT